MSSAILDDAILHRLRQSLQTAYGDRLVRVVLYGSRARGQARPDSDYDVAVFLRDMPDSAVERMRLADVGVEIPYETGEFVHLTPFLAAALGDLGMPLMHEIRREGVEL